MAALGGPTVEASPLLGQNVLIKELSTSQARDELQRVAHLPKLHHKLQKHLIDVAFGHLLGLNEDDSYESEDAVDIESSLQVAKMQLIEDGFPELSQRLASLLPALNTCSTCSVQTTHAYELTEKPLVTTFTEHDALLRLFLSLKGSSPSIRRRQTTFQNTTAATTADGAEADQNNEYVLLNSQQQALTSSVFAEAPNPDALFDLQGTSVLLPSEIFNNTGNNNNQQKTAATTAGGQTPENELAELSKGLQSRPSWAPASVQGLPPLYSGGWLPISPALVAMRGDTRKVVPPQPLNVPLSILAIERTPGAVTGFPTNSGNGGNGRMASATTAEKATSRRRKEIDEKTVAAAATADAMVGSNTRNKDKKNLLGSGTLWTLEEAELARDALLSLQGVYSSLLRLRGALAAADALPHPAAAGILKRIERAASCRHRLQGFIDTFSSFANRTSTTTDSNNSTTTRDPVLSGFAAGLNDLLLSFSQKLSSLETSHATEWVHTIHLSAVDGGPGIRGKVLQGQGLSLTRVAVLTGKVQIMLRVLCSMFWCNEVSITENDNTTTRKCCEWEVESGPPRGPALLSVLCRYVDQAEEPYKESLQYLFARAAQPYLLFLRQWACTTTDIDLKHPYGVITPNKIIATTTTALTLNINKRNSRPVVAIPGRLPAFLAHIEAQLLRSGVQLRLLNSIRQDECRELVAALCSGGGGGGDVVISGGGVSGNNNDVAEEIFKYSLDAPPVFDAFRLDTTTTTFGEPSKTSTRIEDVAAGGGGGGGADEALLLLPHTSIQLEALVQQRIQEEARKEALVNAWSSQLRDERNRKEAVERDIALGAVTLATEAISLHEAVKMEELSRKQSQKQELLKEQLEAIAGSGGGVFSGGPQKEVEEEKGENEKEDQFSLNEEHFETAQEEILIDEEEIKEEKEEETTVVAVVESKSSGGASTSLVSTTTPRSSSGAAVVPMSTLLEATFTSTISLQYTLSSRACLEFFINHLQLETHLSFLRYTFFLEAGDWADEFLIPLSTRIGSLKPLSAHSIYGALQDSLSNSSLGKNSEFLVLAQNLEAEILAGPTALSSFFTCLERQQQNKTITTTENTDILSNNTIDGLVNGVLPQNPASAPLLVSPTALDGLDIVLLRYKTSWPLTALLTEDTSLAYAAVFSAMLRVRRVSAALTKVWGPLAPRLAEAPTIRPSPKTTQRVQKLRVFVRSASQMTSAVQYFQGLTTSGPAWAALSAAVARTQSNKKSSTNSVAVSDLQELLEMHRIYVFTSAVQCLTFCGKTVLQNGIDAALHAALTIASKIETAVEAGRVSSGPRSTEASWMHMLSNDTTWNTIETSLIEFENSVTIIKKELTAVGVSGPLAGLAAVF